jgi:2-polyprenyl-3-methyl-5-hydroxy-6-metoxy-1,4-benzoquinol methylase
VEVSATQARRTESTRIVVMARSPDEWPPDELEHLAACPLCGASGRVVLRDALEDRLFGAAPGRWRLWRCGCCRCAYLDPRPTRESIGAAYRRYFPRRAQEQPSPSLRLGGLRERLVNGYVNGRYGYSFTPANRLGAAVLPLFPKRRWNASLPVRGLRKPPGRPRLLDVGFGDASFLRFMRSAGWEVAGLEADEGAVRAAQDDGVDAAVGTLEDAPFEAGTFDAVTLSHVVEHLHDPVGSLRTGRDLLRPGGLLWLATPNLESPGHRRFGRDWFGLDPPRHLVLFHLCGIDRALRTAGFVALRHPRTYRAGLVLAGSEALAGGTDASSVATPTSPQLRRLARALDVAAAVHPRFGEEVVVVARRPP